MKKIGKICALVVVGMFVCMTLPMSAVAPPPPSVLPFWSLEGNEAGPDDVLGTTNDEDLRIVTNGEQRMVVKADGKVGIGIAIPTEKLDVNGNIRASGHFIAGTTTTYGDGFIDLSEGTNLNIDSDTLFIDNANNRVGIGTADPDTMLHIGNGGNPILKIDGAVNTPGAGPRLRWTEVWESDWGVEAILDGGTGTDALIFRNIQNDQVTLDNILVIKRLSGRIGIGTVNPSNKLTVSGDADFTGNVGIGTTTPASKLHVQGNAPEVALTVKNLASTGNSPAVIRLYSETSSSARWAFSTGFTIGDHDRFDISNEATGFAVPMLSIQDNGNVGIGTWNPQEKLHVAGDIRLDAGGDIAFADDKTRIHESFDDLYIEADDDLYIQPDDDINMDSGTLYVDGFWNEVGIGTTSPTAKAHILQTASADAFRVDDEAGDTTPFVIDQNGNVGIGRTTFHDEIEDFGGLEVEGVIRSNDFFSCSGHWGITSEIVVPGDPWIDHFYFTGGILTAHARQHV